MNAPSTPKILLVDDREENLLALQALLAGGSADLLMARSGTEALELLLTEEVALALVDVQMPEMDGFELAELMRGPERTRHVPIIFITAGHHDRGRVFQGYELGAVDFLYKPLDPRVLRGKVDVFLQIYRQKRELAETVSELREADRRKDEFLAMLSHELRNPLMPIRNSLQVLQLAAPGSEQAKRAAEVIERQTSHLTRLVDDLLDMTRITRGKIQLRCETLDLCDLVRRTLDDHRPAFAQAGIDLQAKIPDEPIRLEADPTRLAQIVGNLLGNAVKFTPRGRRVALSIERQGERAVLTVRDNGVGIAPEILGRVFEPFAQADRTLDRSRGGLGLGLALVKALVEMHEGTVVAKSEGIGRGAELQVVLPISRWAEATARAAPGLEPKGSGTRCRRVLIIEDSRDGAESLKEVVELMGHEVAIAHDGPSGLALAREIGPDIVLCDIGLPEMDGYEVARRLRGDLGDRTPALVAITGYALPEDRRRAVEAGFAYHLTKPPRLEALERILTELAKPR